MEYEKIEYVYVRVCVWVGGGGVLSKNVGRYVIVSRVGRYVRCLGVGRNGLLPRGFCLFPRGCFYRDGIFLPFPYTFS